jgi:signal transduction histidine kinase
VPFSADSLALETEVLFRMALAIGVTTEQQSMLRHAFTEMLRLMAGQGAILVSLPEGASVGEPVFAMPRPFVQQLAKLSESDWRAADDVRKNRKSLVVEGTAGSSHWFRIRDDLLLYLLLKQPLSETLRKGFEPIAQRLDASLRAAEADAALRKARDEAEQAKQRLIDVNQELESRVEERTLQLKAEIEERRAAQLSMMQAEKMAALGGLIAGVAHEVNTPIGVGVTAASHLHDSVRAFDEIYREGKMRRADLEELLHTASQSASILEINLSRASELIKSFKQVAVDQTGGETRDVELGTYVKEILTSLRPLFKNRAIEVVTDIPASLPVTLQAGAFAQIITNLVTNALLHAFDNVDEGQILIVAECADETINLCFSDNGRGMRPEVTARVFDPFFTTRRGSGGNGLGLHIVYNLVTQVLKGEIRCESKVGHGTDFCLRFPEKATLPSVQAPLEH